MVRIGFQSLHSRDFECEMLGVFFNESLYLLDMSLELLFTRVSCLTGCSIGNSLDYLHSPIIIEEKQSPRNLFGITVTLPPTPFG